MQSAYFVVNCVTKVENESARISDRAKEMNGIKIF